MFLTLILPTPKVISHCHKYRARPACSSTQSDQALYCWVFILISLKIILDSAKNFRWIIPFEKLGMVRVKQHLLHDLPSDKQTSQQQLMGYFNPSIPLHINPFHAKFLKWNNPPSETYTFTSLKETRIRGIVGQDIGLQWPWYVFHRFLIHNDSSHWG